VEFPVEFPGLQVENELTQQAWRSECQTIDDKPFSQLHQTGHLSRHSNKPQPVAVRCGWVYGVAECTVWLGVQCGWVYGVAECTVWLGVRCGWVYGVAGCSVWLGVRCGSVYGVAGWCSR